MITYHEIYVAYRQLKYYYYYDNSNLLIKKSIAEFDYKIHQTFLKLYPEQVDFKCSEDQFKKVFETVTLDLYDILNNKKDIETYLLQCKYVVLPKSVKNEDFDKSQRNQVAILNPDYTLNAYRCFVDAPLELHLISFLWSRNVGVPILKLNNKFNYALQPINDDFSPSIDGFLDKNLDKSEDIDDCLLENPFEIFNRYQDGYQKWEEKAKDEITQLQKESKSSIVFRLDIKSYYQSVDIKNLLNFIEDIYKRTLHISPLDKESNHLTKLVDKINHHYSSLYKQDSLNIVSQNQTSILPVGLLSSDIIGVIYLYEFDKGVKLYKSDDASSISSPIRYYGRYVDDLLFVLNIEPDNVKTITSPKELLCTLLPDLFDNSDNSDKITLKNYPKIYLNENKLYYQFFPSTPIINFAKNDSPIFHMPRSCFYDGNEESDPLDELNRLTIKESIINNSPVNILQQEETKANYGKTLYKIIDSLLMEPNGKSKNTIDLTLSYLTDMFSCKYGVENYVFWNKAIAVNLMVAKNQPSEIEPLLNLITDSIDKIEVENEIKNIKEKVIRDLKEYLILSLCFPFSLYHRYQYPISWLKIIKEHTSNDDINAFNRLLKSFRYSNLYRGNLLRSPSIKLTSYIYGEENLYSKKYFTKSIDFSEMLLSHFLYPNIVHFHELNMLYIISTNVNRDFNSDVIFELTNLLLSINYKWYLYFPKDFPQKSILKYKSLSTKLDSFSIKDFNDDIESLFSTDNDEEEEIADNEIDRDNIVDKHEESHEEDYSEQDCSNDFYEEMQQKDDDEDDDEEKNISKKNKCFCVGIVNYKTDEKDIAYSLEKYHTRFKTLHSRFEQFKSMLKWAREGSCDLIVFPELSVPFEMLDFMAQQSANDNIAIIAGLEYRTECVNKKVKSINYIATILPFKHNKTTSSMILLRPKNHFGPREVKKLKGKLYRPAPSKYNLIHWKKVYFGVYNCFELASIEDRQLMKSKIDFLVATEYNKDVRYFDNIAKSTVRDLHAFFIQVNTSTYGDSKILRPKSSDQQIITEVSGGKNTVLLIDDLSINKLRKFQKDYLTNNIPSKTELEFKPLPPEYDKDSLSTRINDKDFDK